METVSRETLDPWWVTGLVEGEGSFTFNRNGRQMAVVFAIKLSGADEEIAARLQQFFGVGRLYRVGATRRAAYYRVNRYDELPRVTAHFDAYPLQSSKANSYRIWREMTVLKQEFRGRNHAALDKLALALSAAQPRNQGR